MLRAFELYASGRHTFETLADQLAGEGYTYQLSNSRFSRTALSRILRNRVYIEEIRWGEKYYPGKHRPLVDRRTFVMGNIEREQRIMQKKRLAEIETMRERLLNAYLTGAIDEQALAAKQAELRDESATLAQALATCRDFAPEDERTALGVFEFAQNAAQIWRGSNMLQKREILESVSLNRMLGDVTLVVQKRKPFDELAKRPFDTSSRDDARRFEPIEALAVTYVQAYPIDRPPQLRFLAGLVNEGFKE